MHPGPYRERTQVPPEPPLAGLLAVVRSRRPPPAEPSVEPSVEPVSPLPPFKPQRTWARVAWIVLPPLVFVGSFALPFVLAAVLAGLM